MYIHDKICSFNMFIYIFNIVMVYFVYTVHMILRDTETMLSIKNDVYKTRRRQYCHCTNNDSKGAFMVPNKKFTTSGRGKGGLKTYYLYIIFLGSEAHDRVATSLTQVCWICKLPNKSQASLFEQWLALTRMRDERAFTSHSHGSFT